VALLIAPCVQWTSTPNTMHGPRMVHARALQTFKPKVATLSMASVYVIKDAFQVDYDFIMVKACNAWCQDNANLWPSSSPSVPDLPRPAFSTASMCHTSLAARGASGNAWRALQIAEMSKKRPHFQHPRKIANLKTQGFPRCP
jgi:hypothetical protein